MRIKRLIIFCLFLSLPIFAKDKTEQINDYSNIKGDFKVIRLGDSNTVVEDKMKYLISKNEVSRRQG